MSTSPSITPRHPLLRLVDVLNTACDEAAEANAWSLSDTELRAALPGLTRVLSRLSETELRMLAEADRRDLGQVAGHHDAAGWYAVATRTTIRDAKAAVRLARSLDADAHETARVALAEGRVLPEQARVIASGIDALPDDLPAGLVADAERHLVGLAVDHDAKDLRHLSWRILEVIAPEVADEHERRLLEAEERRAAAKASFSIRADGQGMMRGRFAIPELHGAMLKKHLDALAAPKHRNAVGAQDDTDPGTTQTVSRPLRLGEAFMEYIATRPALHDSTPKAGGVPATIVVTMTHDGLTGQLESAGLLDTGERISASAARMLTCQAGLIPAVLGTKSQVLDLGRETRFHTEPQRTAIGQRDRGCAEEHCDWPPGFCHIHHRTPWSQGGKTDVKSGLMLCPRHHTLAHDTHYHMTDTMHGKVRFTRRT